MHPGLAIETAIANTPAPTMALASKVLTRTFIAETFSRASS
jgi:hypothetical protein